MAAQVTSSISTIFNGYTNPPITNPKGAQAISRLRKDIRREENPVRRSAARRVFVMKNALFVEFILQIRGTCLFLHIVNKRLHPCEQKPGHPAPNRRFGTFRIKAPRPGQSKRQIRLPNRQRRPQTARPTTLTIERPEYHEKTTHILNGIGGPAGGRMLHGKQG